MGAPTTRQPIPAATGDCLDQQTLDSVRPVHLISRYLARTSRTDSDAKSDVMSWLFFVGDDIRTTSDGERDGSGRHSGRGWGDSRYRVIFGVRVAARGGVCIYWSLHAAVTFTPAHNPG
jgi:hypothetical protein